MVLLLNEKNWFAIFLCFALGLKSSSTEFTIWLSIAIWQFRKYVTQFVAHFCILVVGVFLCIDNWLIISHSKSHFCHETYTFHGPTPDDQLPKVLFSPILSSKVHKILSVIRKASCPHLTRETTPGGRRFLTCSDVLHSSQMSYITLQSQRSLSTTIIVLFAFLQTCPIQWWFLQTCTSLFSSTFRHVPTS